MAFIPVPWAIEGGALNGPEGARILAYAATNGNTGVLGLADLRVSQLDTPGPGVKVGVGAVVILNRSPGYAYQSYIASRPVADDTEPISPNGAASARYDLIVAQVKNPHLPSEAWPMPSDVTFGPYVEAYVYTVTAAIIASRGAALAWLSSNNISAEPLAGLAMPASTTNVLNAMLTDLRAVANPRRTRQLLTNLPSARKNVTSSWADWINPSSWAVDVPAWATTVRVVATVLGGRVDRQSSSTDGKTNGQLRVKLGAASSVYSQATLYDFDAPQNSGTTRAIVGVADSITVPVAFRGSSQVLTLQAIQSGGNQPLYVDTSSSVTLDVEFSESAA